jgi:hypothetical protein
MKKIFLKNLSYIVIASFVVFTSTLLVASYSRADDEEDNEDNYRQPVQTIQQPVEVIQPQPVIQEVPVIVSPVQTPVIQTPVVTPSVSAPTASPKQITTTINKETIIKIPDNSALLAALKDSDNDGIPDVIDKYPGQDDFSYYLLDNNKNGIADDLENLMK